MESASFMEQDVVERSNKEPLQRGMIDSHKPVQVRQRIDTNKFYGVNAQADAHRGHALAHGTRPLGGLLTSMPEISAGHPTLSRSQSACNNSLPVGGLAPIYDNNPPSAEEVAEAAAFEFGLGQETN